MRTKHWGASRRRCTSASHRAHDINYHWKDKKNRTIANSFLIHISPFRCSCYMWANETMGKTNCTRTGGVWNGERCPGKKNENSVIKCLSFEHFAKLFRGESWTETQSFYHPSRVFGNWRGRYCYEACLRCYAAILCRYCKRNDGNGTRVSGPMMRCTPVQERNRPGTSWCRIKKIGFTTISSKDMMPTFSIDHPFTHSVLIVKNRKIDYGSYRN